VKGRVTIERNKVRHEERWKEIKVEQKKGLEKPKDGKTKVK
jgi:hypothetical protein